MVSQFARKAFSCLYMGLIVVRMNIRNAMVSNSFLAGLNTQTQLAVQIVPTSFVEIINANCLKPVEKPVSLTRLCLCLKF